MTVRRLVSYKSSNTSAMPLTIDRSRTQPLCLESRWLPRSTPVHTRTWHVYVHKRKLSTMFSFIYYRRFPFLFFSSMFSQTYDGRPTHTFPSRVVTINLTVGVKVVQMGQTSIQLIYVTCNTQQKGVLCRPHREGNY